MNIINITCIITMLIFTSGCARLVVKEPFYISEQYEPKKTQAIVLLKTINLGLASNLDTDLEMMGLVESQLQERGYKVIDGTKIPIPVKITSSILNDLDFTWINKLNLKPKSWVMVIAVESLKRSPWYLGLRADATLTGYLVEYPAGNVVWEGAGFGSYSAGVLAAAIVDDEALFSAKHDLLRSVPVNGSVIDLSKVDIIDIIPPYLKFAEITGGCPDGTCDQSDKKAHICVIMDKSASFFDEAGDEDEDEFINNYPIYDATTLIGEVASGEYICWTKNPGKTIIHLNMYRPAYFRAKPGKYYYLNVKYQSYNAWGYEEIPLSEAESVLSTYKRRNNTSRK